MLLSAHHLKLLRLALHPGFCAVQIKKTVGFLSKGYVFSLKVNIHGRFEANPMWGKRVASVTRLVLHLKAIWTVLHFVFIHAPKGKVHWKKRTKAELVCKVLREAFCVRHSQGGQLGWAQRGGQRVRWLKAITSCAHAGRRRMPTCAAKPIGSSSDSMA